MLVVHYEAQFSQCDLQSKVENSSCIYQKRPVIQKNMFCIYTVKQTCTFILAITIKPYYTEIITGTHVFQKVWNKRTLKIINLS